MTKVSFFLINDKQGGVCSHTLLCDYHELLEDLLHFFFQPVHMPVNRLFGNLQIPGYFMSAIPLDLHQNDLKGKPVHGDQHMIQFLILNTIQKVLYCFQFCLISGCCYGIQICTCSIMAKVKNNIENIIQFLLSANHSYLFGFSTLLFSFDQT